MKSAVQGYYSAASLTLIGKKVCKYMKFQDIRAMGGWGRGVAF